MAKTTFDALLTKLVHDIAHFGGRDPSGLQVSSTEDGGICVRSAFATAYYPLEGWIGMFNGHLDARFFERPPVGESCPTSTAQQRHGATMEHQAVGARP